MSKQCCGLLELPAEIRKIIFEHALRSDKPVVTFQIDEYQKEAYQQANQPPLLLVNRQIRNEAIELFYNVNNFIIYLEDRQSEDATRWFYKIEDEYAKMLREITFWIRYATANRSITPSGAISISMRYMPRQGRWLVSPEYKWVTTNRKPADFDVDGAQLVKELEQMESNTHAWCPLDAMCVAEYKFRLKTCYTMEKQGIP